MFKSEITATGLVTLTLKDPEGFTIEEFEVPNAVYIGGKQGLGDQQLASPTISKVSHMAVGSGSPGADAVPSGTAPKLGTELARVALTGPTRGGTESRVLSMTGTFGAGVGTGALTEAGLFSVVTANTVSTTAPMYAATTFSTINKGASDTLTITWTITVG